MINFRNTVAKTKEYKPRYFFYVTRGPLHINIQNVFAGRTKSSRGPQFSDHCCM